MSVTVNQQPNTYTPGLNPQTFEATSNQIAFADFLYYVVCTDDITSEQRIYKPKQRPTTGELTFPAQNFARKYLKDYVPNNVYGWQKCTDAIRKIKVNIGEYYSSAVHSGTDIEYIIWNGVERALEWPFYSSSNYVYNSDSNNLKYLTSLTPEPGYRMGRLTTYSDKSQFLYVLTQTAGDFQTLRITTYDSNGNAVGQSDISNPYEASYTYTDKYLAIDIGHKGLTNISAFSVTGTYPILDSTVSYYIIQDISLVGSPPAATITDVCRVDIACEPKYDVYTLHYKANSGKFETLHFNKNSEFTENVEQTYYRVNQNTLASNQYKYTAFSDWEKTLSSSGTDNIKINTGWLSESDVAAHREIISSPKVYIDYGSTIGLVPCKVLTRSILKNKEYNNKLFAIALEIEPGYKNNY